MDHSKNAIKLLKKQIEKLENENFDLDAWKGGTQAVLERLFGSDSSKIQQLHAIKIDYSSWALRDSTSKYNPRDTVKRLGRELLDSAIDEIDLMGLPQQGSKRDEQALSMLMQEHFDKSIAKSIVDILEGEFPKSKKRGKLKSQLKKLTSDDKTELIIDLLLLNK